MNGNGSGIVPTVDLATNNNNGYGYGVPVMPMYGGYGYGNNGGFFGGDGIWALILIAIIFGGFNGNSFGSWGNNNVATTDYISSEFTQRDISQLSNTVTNGHQNLSNLISSGFADNATNICNLRSDVLTGNMSLSNQIQDVRFTDTLNACNTQRDILQQTTQLANQANVNALNDLAKQEECCCRLENAIRSDGEATRSLITSNTIQDLRDRLNNAETVISNQSVVNQLSPRPTPSYIVSSPYQSIFPFNNGFGFGWGNGFNYGNGFFGNTIV